MSEEIPPAELYARNLLERFPQGFEARTFRYKSYDNSVAASHPHRIVVETHMANAQMRVEEGLQFATSDMPQHTLDMIARMVPGAIRNQAQGTTWIPTQKKLDHVDHPKHYNEHPSGVECITIIEHFSLNVGNAMKYLWRAGLKPGATEIDDLRKAEWYIAREIQRLLKG